MRIQEVMGKTGLSRRTIHYYIDQKLIIPPVNEGNGYHDFTGEDVQKLFIIRKLRRLIGAEIRVFQHSRKLVERLADRELAA